MHLIDLPEEILIIVFRELDIYSLQNLYNTCKRTRTIVCMLRVLKCELSRNVMATANSLKLSIFKDISQNLLELNMCGVPDLCKTVFLPAMKKLRNLKILNVAYTNLNILDLIEIYKICPTLKDITINFSFGMISKISATLLLRCQSLFKHFEKVHFVGSISSLLNSKLAFCLLSKATLDNLTYSISETCWTYDSLIEEDLLGDVKLPQFNQFLIYFLDWKFKRHHISHSLENIMAIPVLSMTELEISKYEYIIIRIEDYEATIFTSPMFEDFFKDKFDIVSTLIPQAGIELFGNVVFMLWPKDSVNFDDYFYHNLKKHIEPYFPNFFKWPGDLHDWPSKHNWFYTYATPYADDKHLDKLRAQRKKRVAAKNFVLDYDVVFENRSEVELTLNFKYPLNNTIALKSDSSFLKKLTYLSLISFTRYTSDFFNILFQCCDNLITLNLESSPVSPCSKAIARSLMLSKSLKNIRLVEKVIDFKSLFLALGECLTIENIHIVDKSVTKNNLYDPNVLLEKCARLYSIYIEALMTGTTYSITVRHFKIAKQINGRPYVNVKIQHHDKLLYKYDPFVEVFKLNPIKPM